MVFEGLETDIYISEVDVDGDFSVAVSVVLASGAVGEILVLGYPGLVEGSLLPVN